MLTLYLHGNLAKFGKQFQLDANTAAEALKAVMVQIPNLRQAISQGFYKLRIGKSYINPDNLNAGLYMPLNNESVHLTPVVKGAKKAGIFNVIVGVVLIVASYWTGGSTFAMGMGMLAGGVAQMLTKTPPMQAGNEAEKRQSTSIHNLQNMAAQGQMIPLAYGKIRCGSMIISQGVETFDA